MEREKFGAKEGHLRSGEGKNEKVESKNKIFKSVNKNVLKISQKTVSNFQSTCKISRLPLDRGNLKVQKSQASNEFKNK